METLIVLAIVLILSASVGFTSSRYLSTARRVSAKTQIESFKLGLLQYCLDTGAYPNQAEGLDALRRCPPGVDAWKGPYLERDLPLDPWGHSYIYYNPGPDGSEFGVACLGADGQNGGRGKDEDILSWDEEGLE